MPNLINQIQIGNATYDVGYPLIEGGGTTDATAKTSAWTGTHSGITSYYDGLTIRYKIGVAGQTTTTLNINGLGAKQIYRFGTTTLTTHFPVGSIINLVYHADLNDGCWMCNDYDANTNTQARTYKTTSTATYYPILTRYSTSTPTTYTAEYTRYSSKITANHGSGYLKAVKFIGDLEGNVKGNLEGNLDGSMILQRMTKSYKEHAYDQIPETFEVWFNGSDALSAVEMPENYCITEFKKGSNHRFIAEATCLTSGKRYQSSNMVATADTTARGTWVAWQELPSAADKTKLDGIAEGANKYVLPTATTNTLGGVKVDATLSTTSTNPVQNKVVDAAIKAVKNELLNGAGEAYNTLKELGDLIDDNTDAIEALEKIAITPAERTKLSGIEDGANKYTHPTYASKTSGLYKITVDGTGHISGATAVSKADITALGIPSTNTTYATATTTANGLMSSADKVKLNSIAEGANKYVLPTATNSTLGGVKIGSNITLSDGTISLSKTNVTTALGYTPPTTNTTYATVTTTANGLMSAADKVKLNGIEGIIDGKIAAAITTALNTEV